MSVLGDIERSAVLVPRQGAYFEADALAMIRKCIQKFTDEGRGDFALVAKELEKMIIDQIESENGLTRRYMNAAFAAAWVVVPSMPEAVMSDAEVATNSMDEERARFIGGWHGFNREAWTYNVQKSELSCLA